MMDGLDWMDGWMDGCESKGTTMIDDLSQDSATLDSPRCPAQLIQTRRQSKSHNYDAER
jgi:hypothetical protein